VGAGGGRAVRGRAVLGVRAVAVTRGRLGHRSAQ